MHEVKTANNVTWKQSINTSDRVVRPSKIETTGVASRQNWTTGVFDFDGASNIHQMGNAHFKYDVRSRLVEGQVDVGTLLAQQAQLDTFGNITQLTTGGAGLTVPVSSTTNRLVTSGGNTFQYDVAGNLIDSTGGGHQAWGWDRLSVMKTMQATGFSALYIYDANDERILSWRCAQSACGAGNSHERWTLRGFGGEVLRAYEGPDTPGLAWEEDFVYRGRQLLATVREGEVLYVHPDHLGSPRQVTNAAGAQVKRHHFYPFGQETSTAADTDIPLKFTGHERDQNSGGRSTLDYMHARYTSVTWARFLSVDPVRGSIKYPQTWNRYSYVANRPMGYIDPTGKSLQGVGRFFWDVCGEKGSCSNETITIVSSKAPYWQDLKLLFGYPTYGKDGVGLIGPSPDANKFDLHRALGETKNFYLHPLYFIKSSKDDGKWDSKKFCVKEKDDPCQHWGNYVWESLPARAEFRWEVRRLEPAFIKVLLAVILRKISLDFHFLHMVTIRMITSC